MSIRSIGISDRLHRYLLDVSVRESALMRRLRRETARLADGAMQIAPEQGQMLAFLVELTGAEKAIEIGTFTGYSALWIAGALPARGRLVTCDVSVEWTDIARPYWREAGLEDKIELRLAPALETLDALIAEGQSGGFDLAFLDGDKPEYQADFERVLTLLRPGGLAVIDNVLWSGRVADGRFKSPDTEALRAFNLRLHNDRRVSISLLPVGDGVTLVRKNL